MLRKVKIFAGLYNYNFDDFKDYDYIIGVDRGAYELIKNNINVDLAIGDFDSVNNDEFLLIKNNAQKTVKLNPIKDDTDLEHVFANYLTFNDIITCYGVIGERLDHTYNNLILLAKYSNLNITYFDLNNKINILKKGRHIIKKEKYKYFSIYAIEDAKLNLSSCAYPLNNYKLVVHDTLITSNEIINNEVIIDILEGKVYFIETN